MYMANIILQQIAVGTIAMAAFRLRVAIRARLIKSIYEQTTQSNEFANKQYYRKESYALHIYDCVYRNIGSDCSVRSRFLS